MCQVNFEKTKRHSIELLVSDSGVPSRTARFAFSVVVTDDNDAPQNIKLSSECLILCVISQNRGVEHSLIVQWVFGSIPPGGPIELFLVPACAPQLV